MGEFLDAAFWLGCIYVIWKAACVFGRLHEGKIYSLILRSIATAAVLACISWANYGTHVEDADPLFGVGRRVMDSNATERERNRHGVFVFAGLSALITLGTVNGYLDKLEKLQARRKID